MFILEDDKQILELHRLMNEIWAVKCVQYEFHDCSKVCRWEQPCSWFLILDLLSQVKKRFPKPEFWYSFILVDEIILSMQQNLISWLINSLHLEHKCALDPVCSQNSTSVSIHLIKCWFYNCIVKLNIKTTSTKYSSIQLSAICARLGSVTL